VLKSHPVQLHSIHPRNFRNLDNIRLEFSSHANFISGLNGQGKTNLLEAVYWLLTLRGKRGNVSECTGKGADGFTLNAQMTWDAIRHRINLKVEGRSKKLLIDESPLKRRRDYLENVLVVDFFPEDLLILIMEPQLRRRFLDLACVQYHLPHEETLRRYRKLREQRNGLLKQNGYVDPKLLDSYDQPMAEAASMVTSARLNLLGLLGERTNEIFREGIGEKYKTALQYITSIEGIPGEAGGGSEFDPLEFSDLYHEELKRTRGRDMEAGLTTTGPHRDDWGMTLDGKAVRAFASRGEVRSAMFALHLARFHVLADRRGIRPVVLIDDVMSELDSSRRVRVLELLPPGQIFLTACDPPPEISAISGNDLAHFNMSKGKAERVS